MAKWEDDDWVTKYPEKDKIKCKDCIFRENDRKLNERQILDGATLGICKVYTVVKPSEILFDGEDCPYYQKDD